MEQKPPQSSDSPQQPPVTPGQTPVTPPPSDGNVHTENPATPKQGEQPNPGTNASQQPSQGQPSAPQVAAPIVGQAGGGDPAHVSPPPGGASAPGVPGLPEEHQIHKSNTMLFAIATLFIVIIGAVLVTIMSGSSQSTDTPAVKPTTPPVEIPTAPVVPTTEPSPATLEDELDAVNVTEDDADLKEAEQDLQSL